MSKKSKVLFLGQFPEGISPSQRFRIEAFKPYLDCESVEYIFQPFISKEKLEKFRKPGHFVAKILTVIAGFGNRIFGLFKYSDVDYVFIQREASPIGPPFIEFIYAKILRKKIIFDFDDSIWIPDSSGKSGILRWLKCYWKVKWICRWSYKVVVGNHFLASFAQQYSSNVVLIPTSVDTLRKYIPDGEKHRGGRDIVIGWTGSFSTLTYLDLIFPVLKELEKEVHFEFLVICDKPPSFSLKSLRFIPWSEITEIEDLNKIDIGVMPLIEDEWTEGKCGFKLIQYLSLGIPAVASPVGVNKDIIDHNRNGFLCQTREEWRLCLMKLIKDCELRCRFGVEGRRRIQEVYSLQANLTSFLGLFN